MSEERKFEVANAFGNLHGISFYDARRINADDGYKNKRMSYEDFDWDWYVDRNDSGRIIVRAVRLKHPVRVLGYPVSVNNSAAYDYPNGYYIVHDLNRVWAMKNNDFDMRYVSIADLVDFSNWIIKNKQESS